jgi:hypothetical protein
MHRSHQSPPDDGTLRGNTQSSHPVKPSRYEACTDLQASIQTRHERYPVVLMVVWVVYAIGPH